MRRVVIAGLGTVNPLGHSVSTSFASMLEGEDGIRAVDEATGYKFGCVTGNKVSELSTPLLTAKERNSVGRSSQLLLSAASEAFNDAELHAVSVNERANTCLFSGTTLGGLASGESFFRQLACGRRSLRPTTLLGTSLYAANDLTMQKLGLRGASTVLSTACSASAHAVGCAFESIRMGHSDIALAGGFETMSEVTIAGFGILRSLTKDKIRPFDSRRSGLLLGEGAAVLVLESLEHALARGVHMYAEIVGYGGTSDAYHMTAPHPAGDGAARAITMALQDGRIDASEVDYIAAHGTATRANDPAETLAIKRTLGEHARKSAVSSIKSMVGHLLGGAGALGALTAVLSIHHSKIPPTINYEASDSECDLDYVPNAGRSKNVRVALANSFGFGGNNCVLAFRKLTL
jgi:3-oxoacyl-[acyl-carrier-protein] synthase II